MSTNTPCVLVIEDEAGAREVICDSLEAVGCKAIGASDGSEAIKKLERSSTTAPCVILLDLMMPGMNGWQFHEWLRRHERFAGVPVVLLSAIRDLREEARRLEAAAYLEKPISFDTLLEAVTRFCGPCEEDAV